MYICRNCNLVMIILGLAWTKAIMISQPANQHSNDYSLPMCLRSCTCMHLAAILCDVVRALDYDLSHVRHCRCATTVTHVGQQPQSCLKATSCMLFCTIVAETWGGARKNTKSWAARLITATLGWTSRLLQTKRTRLIDSTMAVRKAGFCVRNAETWPPGTNLLGDNSKGMQTTFSQRSRVSHLRT